MGREDSPLRTDGSLEPAIPVTRDQMQQIECYGRLHQAKMYMRLTGSRSAMRGDGLEQPDARR